MIFSEGLHPSKIGNDYSCSDSKALIISFLKMPFGACRQLWQRWKEKENVFLATCKVQLALQYPQCSKMHIPSWSTWITVSRMGARSQLGQGGHVSPAQYEPGWGTHIFLSLFPWTMCQIFLLFFEKPVGGHRWEVRSCKSKEDGIGVEHRACAPFQARPHRPRWHRTLRCLCLVLPPPPPMQSPLSCQQGAMATET